MNREITTGAASVYPLTGDVSSSAGSPTVTVTGIQNIPVEAGFLTNDDFLIYDSTSNTWVPRLVAPSDLPLATSTTPGIVEPDNTTITVSGGVISSVGGGLTQLTGDVTAGPGTGSQAATVVATHLASPLPVVQGGTGTATPSLVAGTNVTITGSFPNQTVSATGSGTVTSVGLTVPSEFSVSGSPVTSSGTLAITKANESANTVWAGPTTGSPAAPAFRSLVSADLPVGSATQIGGLKVDGSTITATAGVISSTAGTPNGIIQLLQSLGGTSGVFPSANKAGSCIIVEFSDSAATSATCSDTNGNTYTLYNAQSFSPGYYGVFVALNVKAGANTITIGGNTLRGIYEYSNVASVDANVSAKATGTATLSTGSATTTTPSDRIHMTAMWLSASSGTATNASGWQGPLAQAFGSLNTNMDSFGTTQLTQGALSNTVTLTGTGGVGQIYAGLICLSPQSISALPAAAITSLPLPIAQGGTGTATPSLVAGTNVTITGSFPNQTISATAGGGGVFPITTVQECVFQTGGSNVSSFTFTLPQAAAASGNTLFMFIACDGSGTATLSASGWTTDINQAASSFARLMVMHKASAGETSITITATATTNFSILFYEFLGSHTLDHSSSGALANTNVLVTPAITPSANSLVFSMACFVGGAPVLGWVNPPTLTPWKAVSVAPPIGGGRSIGGLVYQTAGAGSSITPPAINAAGITLFGGGGVAYSTFSIV